MNEQPEIFTFCKDCAFEEDLDCKLNKLELLEANGATLLEESGHTLINGRLCNFKRDIDWLDKYKLDYLDQLDKEVCIKYSVFINSYNVSTLSQIIDYCLAQTIVPSNYFIVYNNDNFSRQITTIQQILNMTNKKWALKTPTKEVEYEYEFINEFVFNSPINNPFALYLRDSHIPSKDLIYKINYTLNKELKQVMAFIDFDYIFAPWHLIKMFGFESLYTNIAQNGHIDKICRV